MAMQKATIGAVAAIAVMAAVISTLGALVATSTVSNSGNITAVGVGVYSDSGCTTVLSSISWGTLNPGDTKTYTLYVKNTGTVSITLTMAVTNWNPSSASSYITVNWDKQNSVLAAGSSVKATLTLVVSSNISSVTDFSFDVTVTGTQ
jgi:uncharacterized repeat protein (TIGR01451 family)